MTPQALLVTSSETFAPLAHGWPVLRLGFRPFYLAAALFAGLVVPLLIALFLGPVTLHLTVAPVLWHAHEMLFGFAAAVIIGFLLTAGKVWTGLAMPRGPLLGAIGDVVGRRSRRRIGGDVRCVRGWRLLPGSPRLPSIYSSLHRGCCSPGSMARTDETGPLIFVAAAEPQEART